MSHQKSLNLIITAILVPSFLVGCGGSTPTPVTEEPTASVIPQIATTTQIPIPSNTPIPTTQIPVPSHTPIPTGTTAPTATPEIPYKILFVGNSFTFWNNGLEYQMEQLAGSASPPLVIEADAIAKGGYTLKKMWEFSNVRELIGEGAYDVVVLQGDIPETMVDTFHEYARKFDVEIKEVGAEPVLFMAWSYERLGRITMEEIDQAHRDIAAELGIKVAPVGLAWQRAMEERPDLDMYDTDREHPSIHGTYLAINVVYATVFGESPLGLTYLPSESSDVSAEEAAFLQRIAWETVQEYHEQ